MVDEGHDQQESQKTGRVFLSDAFPLDHSDPNAPPLRIPEPMSEAYHKARSNLVLVSAVLLAWSTLGLKVSEVAAEGRSSPSKGPSSSRRCCGLRSATSCYGYGSSSKSATMTA